MDKKPHAVCTISCTRSCTTIHEISQNFALRRFLCNICQH
ncbi:hypothetical protein RDI58_007496 [Solanum bulbocastanum]|uniref:Uncharacterized protein n=1 Tax=Solanum bulbocastanum TaxID=147425 RepID=A0AAN8TSY2_SOLBU